MDAIKYIKTLRRLCKMQKTCNGCLYGCPLRLNGDCIAGLCDDGLCDGAEKAAQIVEQWSKDHPVKTRQSEFLKMFPNANSKIITRLLPCSIDSNMKPLRCAKYGYLSITCRCDRCCDDYWKEEVTDND